MSEKPRAYTPKEMRAMFIDHLKAITKYWATTPLDRPEFRKELEAKGEVLYRMEGLLFSFLVTLDGGSMDLPAFDLSPLPIKFAVVPSPADVDEEYHRDQGENWWPQNVVINNCQLHDILSTGNDSDD